jgi:hypothetical protein
MTRWALDPQLASVDAGCRGSDALRVLAERGLPPETAWPWEPRKVNSRPPLSAAWDARDRRGVRGTYAVYASNLDARIRAVRAALGAQKGVVLSIPVWAEDTEDGGSRVLTYRDVQPRGLHLVQVLDCSDMGIVRIQNSWGASWRDFGRCWLPPVYLQRSEFVAVIDPKESPK